MLVCTVSGVVIEVGTSVVVLIAHSPCSHGPARPGVSTTLMDPRLTGIIRLG